MGILSRTFCTIHIRFRRIIIFTIVMNNIILSHDLHIFRDTRRVCTHVRNQTYVTIGTDFKTFVKILSNHHGTLCTKVQLTNTILLQRRRCKGRCRFTRTFALFNICHYCIGSANSIYYGLRFTFSSNIDFLTFNMSQFCCESLFSRRFKIAFNSPVFLWHESLNFSLSFTDKSNCNGLHTTCTEAFTNLFP